MNRIASWILAQFLLLFTAQGVPPVLNYAGQVAVNGEAFEGNGLFKFALVNTDGTTTYWSNDGTSVDGSEPQSSVAVLVYGGLYAVLVGNTAQQGMGAIDPAVFAQHSDAKLRVWFSDGVNGFQQLSPDRPFASVPYAFTAGAAQTAGSAPIANGAVNLDMLSQDVKTQINATIGLERLSSEIISKLEQNATITNGSVMGSKMADGAVTASKIASKTIGKDQISDSILKYLKPEITIQPHANTIYAGGDGSVSFSAEGKYLTYQWKKDGVDLTGETNATLNITDANATLHDGNYSVVVSNDFGSVESGKIPVDVNTTWSTEGLVGWWKFDEGSGTVAYDSSGNGNNGNLSNGPTWATGKIGGALSFDGVNDYINLGKNFGNFGRGAFSISLWIHANSAGVLISKRGTSSFGNFWVFRSRGDLLYSIEFDAGNSSNHSMSGIGETPITGWKHIVFIRTGSLITLFQNGNEDGTANMVHTQNFTNSYPVLLGVRGAGDDGLYNHYKGLIDDVRIYDRALSAEEVQALYNLRQ